MPLSILYKNVKIFKRLASTENLENNALESTICIMKFVDSCINTYEYHIHVLYRGTVVHSRYTVVSSFNHAAHILQNTSTRGARRSHGHAALTVINDNNMLLDMWTYLTTDYALIGEL